MGRPTADLRASGDERRNKAIAPYALAEILRLQLDRLAMWPAMSRAVPCPLIALHRVACSAALPTVLKERSTFLPEFG